MRHFLLLAVSLLTLAGHSQYPDYVREHARALASEQMKGRGYVNGGVERAAQYLSDEFTELGLIKLSNSYFQNFEHSVNTFPGEMVVKVGKRELIPGLDYLVDPASPSIKGDYRLMPIELDSPVIQGDMSGLTIEKDCIFLIDLRMAQSQVEKASAKSAAHKLSMHSPVMVLTANKLTWAVASAQLAHPVIEVRGVDIRKRDRIYLDIFAELKPEFSDKNVLGLIRGTARPDSFVVFTAHYDHLGMMGDEATFYGANDNASGTAVLLSLAKHYVDNPPEYTCVFIAFAGEEAGLVGSRYFVEHPLVDLRAIRFLINLDLMGSGVDGITVVNATGNESEFSMMQEINEKWDLLPKVKSRGQAANSDHYFFAEAGVPAIFIYALGGSQAYHDIHDVGSNLTFKEYPDIFRLITELVIQL